MSGRRDHWRRIEALLEQDRQHSGPPAAVRDAIGERVEATAGAEVVKAQVLEHRIVRPPRRHLRLVPKGARPALASLVAYAPFALATLGAVSIASAVAYVSLPHDLQERVRRALHLPGSEADEHLSGLPRAVGSLQGEPTPSTSTGSNAGAPLEDPAPLAPAPSLLPAANPPIAGVTPEHAARRRTSKFASRASIPARPEPIPVRPEPVEGRSRSTTSPAPLPPAFDVSLAEERALLERARANLLHGSGAGALQALADHERRFPGGRMLEQREALTIQALVQVGRRDEAYWRARQFRALFPDSLMLQVIPSTLNREEP